MTLRYRSVVVDDVRTAYIDAGEGPTVVLLHSGEYGASALLCWEHNIEALATRYRVLAPDWLGFGGTDKVFDFAGGRARRIRHMRRFLEVMDVTSAAFIGSSMGGGVLSGVAAERPVAFPVAALVLSSAGGFAPDNASRRALLDYDCTVESMRRIVSVIFHDPRWASDDEYVLRRHAASLEPGAWEACSAPRLRRPDGPARSSFGQPDRVPYEQITVPTLLVAGADDPLRERGYAAQIADRLPHGQALVYPDCAHMPHIEHAQRWNEDVLAFLAKEYA
ncbi:alpha/beta hydrolase [Dactylosporangium sp. NPDC000555]|uniref:alpha/beta fold hydrolase n=1 Tax=Dactylosporangium sp. NPDC000555 TaxID=3154260 RepID=UPI00332C1228